MESNAVESSTRELEQADDLDSLAVAIARREPLLKTLAHNSDAAMQSAAAGAKAIRTLRLLRDETRSQIQDAGRLRENLLRQSPPSRHSIDTRG